MFFSHTTLRPHTPPPPRRSVPASQESVSAISPPPLLCRNSPAHHQTRARKQQRQTIPRRRIRTHESPRGAIVTQAPAGAIDHGQIRAAVSGRDCGWRTCNALGTARRRIRDSAGRLTESPRENPEDAVAIAIEANRELTSPSCSPSFPPPNLSTSAPHLSALRSGTPDL